MSPSGVCLKLTLSFVWGKTALFCLLDNVTSLRVRRLLEAFDVQCSTFTLVATGYLKERTFKGYLTITVFYSDEYQTGLLCCPVAHT